MPPTTALYQSFLSSQRLVPPPSHQLSAGRRLKGVLQSRPANCGAGQQVVGGFLQGRPVIREAAQSIKRYAILPVVAMSVQPAIVIGGGRVGQALVGMGDGTDVLVRRGEKVPEHFEGPIIVATRNDALEAVIKGTPEKKREDLVFIQNGMLEPFLASKGLEKSTQVLVYFAVAKLGDAPIDGRTDLNPEGLTAANGKWAEAVAARLQAGGLSCKVLGRADFRKSMLEKLIWISAFMLVGVRHPGSTVGDVEAKYRSEVGKLMQELAFAAERETGLSFDAKLEERLCAYARSVSSFPTAIKEFEWRNGWFYGLSHKAMKAGQPDPCPVHTAWLKEVGAV